MWPDRVSNPGPLTYESGAILTALRGPANKTSVKFQGDTLIFGDFIQVFYLPQITTLNNGN